MSPKQSAAVSRLAKADVRRSPAVDRLSQLGEKYPVTGAERTEQVLNGFMRSALSVVNAPIEALGRVGEITEQMGQRMGVPQGLLDMNPQLQLQKGAGALGNSIRELLWEAMPDTRAASEFWAGKMPQALGSSAAFAAGGAAGAAAKVPSALGTVFLGGSMNAVQLYDEARANGASDEAAIGAFLGGGVIGASEYFGLRRILGRLNTVSGGRFMRAVKDAAMEGLDEGVQETAQGVANNLAARYLWDEEKVELAKLVKEDGAAGALTGVILSMLVSAGGRSMPAPPGEYKAPTPELDAAGVPLEFIMDPNAGPEPDWRVVSDFSLTEEEKARAAEQGIDLEQLQEQRAEVETPYGEESVPAEEAAPEPSAPKPKKRPRKKPTAADARKRARDTGSLREFIRAEGGIRTADSAEGPELHATFSDKEIGRGTFGLGPMVRSPRSKGGGVPWDDMLQRAVEAGFFPGSTQGDLTYSDLFQAIEDDILRPEQQMERADREMAAAYSEDVPFARTSVFNAISRIMAPRGANLTASRAQTVQNALGDQTLREALSDRPEAVVKALTQAEVLTADDLPGIMRDGQITRGGVDAIEAAVLGSLTRSPRLVARIPAETSDSLVEALPGLLELRERHQPFGGDLDLALDAVTEATETGLSVRELARTPDTIPRPWKRSPVAVALAGALHGDAAETFATRTATAANDIAGLTGERRGLYPRDATPESLLLEHFSTGIHRPAEEHAPSSKSIWENAPEFLSTPDEAAALDPTRTSNPLFPAPGIVGLAWSARDSFIPIDDRGLPGLEEGLAELAGMRPVSAVDVIRAGTKAFESLMPSSVLSIITGPKGTLQVKQGTAARGRVPKGTAGYFHMVGEYVRMQRANDIATFTHEAGHAIHKLVLTRERQKGADPITSDLVPPKAQAQLVELGRSIYGDEMPAKGLATEGWAHFFELWVLDPPTAQKLTPDLYTWFESEVLMEQHPRFGAALDRVRELATRWRLQGSEARAQASIADNRSLKERMARMGSVLDVSEMRRAWWESLDTVQQIEKAGLSQGQSRKPFSKASLFRGTSGAVAEYMVNEAMIDAYGMRVGNSLKAVLAPTKKWDGEKQRKFWTWLWARRTLAMQGDMLPEDESTKDFKPRETGLSLADARFLVHDLENSEYEAVANGIYEWSQGTLNYFAQSSPHARAVVQKIMDANLQSTGTLHGYYVPLQREFNELDEAYTGFEKKHGTLRASGGLARFMGSGRRVKPFADSLVANAQITVDRAQKEGVLNDIFYLAENMYGMGHVARRLSADEIPDVPVGNINVLKALGLIGSKVKAFNERSAKLIRQASNELQRQVRAGKKAAEVEETFDMERAESTQKAMDLAGETLTVFSEPIQIKGRGPIVQRYNSSTGEVEFWEVNGPLYEELSNIQPYARMQQSKLWQIVARVPRDMFALGATALSPRFGLLTNPTVDLLTMNVNTRYDGSVFVLIGKWLKAMGHGALYRVSAGRVSSLKKSENFKDPYLELFHALGLQGATYFGQDQAYTRRTSRNLQAGPVQRALDPTLAIPTAYQYFKDVISFPEIAARRAEMELVAKQVGWKPGDSITMDQLLEMGLAARRVTVDFQALGHKVRAINSVAPFFGPAFAGYQSHARAAKRNTAQFVLRGLTMTVPTLALWWYWKDDERYKAMTARDKYGYWYIDRGPNEQPLRIRRPHEIGFGFASIPEILMDNAYKQHEKGMGAMLRGIFTDGVGEATEAGVEWVLPSLRPPGAATMLELATNTRELDLVQMAAGKERRKIVPDTQQSLEPAEQSGPFTSKAAIKAGEILNISPRKIDHFIRGMTGSAGGRLLDVAGQGSQRKRFDEPSDIPMFGVLFKPGATYGYRNVYEEQLGEMYSKAISLGDSKVREESPEQRRIRLFLTDAWRGVRLLSTLENEYAQTKAERNSFSQERVSFAKDAVDAVLSGDISRGEARSVRKRAEREKKRRDRAIERDLR